MIGMFPCLLEVRLVSNNYNKEYVYNKSINLLRKQLDEANKTIRTLRRELAVAKRDESYKDKESWAELDMKDYHGRSN